MNTSYFFTLITLYKKVEDFIVAHKIPAIAVVWAILLLLPTLGMNQIIMRIVIMICIYTILALGLNILTGYTGQVSLGNAGFYAIGAYTAGICFEQFGWNFPICMLAGIIVAAMFGLILGIPTLRLSGSYLSIATLGFGEIVRMIALNWDAVTNGPLGIKNIQRPEFFGIQLTLPNGGLYYLILALLLLTLAFCYMIINSKTGRAFISIREDELAATLMGIRTTRYKVLAFVISAAISGMAGAFYASFIRYIDPNTFTFDTSIMIISIVILGGMGTLKGMFIGSILLVSFPEILRFMASYRFVVYGLILVLMMRFRPQGILGGESKRPFEFIKGVQFRAKPAKLTGEIEG